MLSTILNNPYRQLGVYSTSSQKEVVANQGKMKAFLKVGKQVSFPLDLNGILPAVVRTVQSVAEANSKLALPAEQLKYAQFWFAKCTQIDEIACGKLINGDIDGAIEIWNKKVTASSLQNLIVCAFIKNQCGIAISHAETLYSSYGDEFVKMVLGNDALATSENLAHDFLDILCEEYEPVQFVGYFTNAEWMEYVGRKSTTPLIKKITSAIDFCKLSKGKGATARLNAGTKLMNETKAELVQLKQYVSAADLLYQMIADKLGLEILQCGIDYYNESEEADAARKAMVLQKYAQSVVVGKMAKDRCDENVDILKKIIANLPPAEVFAEDMAIKEELRKFCNLPDKICHAITLLNNTKPHLQRIKSKLGNTNSFYLKVSTQVVGNALHNLIEEVNQVQDLAVSFMKNNSSSLSPTSRALALRSVMSKTLGEAWEATKIMDTFDMEYDFKTNRYNQQRASLKNICDSMGVSTSSYSPSTARVTSTPRSTTSPKPSTSYSSSSSSPSSNSSSSSSDNGCLIGIICLVVCAAIGGAVAGGGGAVFGAFVGIGIYGKIVD